MKTLPNRLVISSIILLVCPVYGFSQENRPLSIPDFVGTYRLDRIENPWFSDNVREQLNEDFTRLNNTFVIGKDYYKLSSSITETPFQIREIDEEGIVRNFNNPKLNHPTSGARGLFPGYPRLFNSALVCYGSIWVIEVLDYDTVVIHYRGSYLLYRRVE